MQDMGQQGSVSDTNVPKAYLGKFTILSSAKNCEFAAIINNNGYNHTTTTDLFHGHF